jgi:hypothetical protein
MRITTLLTVPILAGLIALPTKAPAQLTITFGTRLGPEVGVSAYQSERLGDWRSNYRQWTPVTLYDVNGRYYRNQVPGARPVLVYRFKDQYFWPPQDQGWNGADKRYDYRRRPNDTDYGRARPYTPTPVAFDPRLGAEVGVLGYSVERAGDWRTNYRRWTPVTLYEVNGRYFPNSAPGARPVAMYRYRDEYFLPPTDQAWNDFDKRFDHKHHPNKDDNDRVRNRP